QVGQTAPMPDWRQVHLVGPACELGHERKPPVVADDRARAALLAGDHVAVEAAAGLPSVSRLRRELALEHRRHERVGVDLAVRVAERDSYLLAAVLEHV